MSLPQKNVGKKPDNRPSLYSQLTKQDEGEPKYLPPPAINPQANLDEQIDKRLRDLVTKDIGLGYFHGAQKDNLTENLRVVGGVLCFVEKFWKKLLGTSFPSIPRRHSSSKLLEAVSLCRRNNRKNEKLFVKLVAKHMGTLATLHWNSYKKTKFFKVAVEVSFFFLTHAV